MPMKIMYIKGQLVKYDSDDYNLIKGWSWYLNKGDSNISWYVARSARVGKRIKKFYLHRVIAHAKKGDKIEFINGNTLDCCKVNLRKNGRRLVSGRSR